MRNALFGLFLSGAVLVGGCSSVSENANSPMSEAPRGNNTMISIPSSDENIENNALPQPQISKAGELCNFSQMILCEDGNYCKTSDSSDPTGDGVCAALTVKEEGEGCGNFGDICSDGLSCLLSEEGGDPKCYTVRTVSEGESCAVPNFCEPDMYCDQVCKKMVLRQEGESCGNMGEACEMGLICQQGEGEGFVCSATPEMQAFPPVLNQGEEGMIPPPPVLEERIMIDEGNAPLDEVSVTGEEISSPEFVPEETPSGEAF